MAKLNGVKVIEAIGGEITKVAYDGAEYALVPSTELGKAQIGDLVLITDDTWVGSTKGEFYLTVEISGNNPRIIDDIGDKDSNFYDGSYELFRKIEEASELTTKFNVGDVVVTLEKCGYAKFGQGVMLAGAIGKVKAVKGDKLTVKFNKKQPTPNATKQGRKNFVVRTSEVRLATAEEAATIAKKYVPQEGDIVVVTANKHGSQNSVGDIGKVTKVLSYKIVVDVPNKTEGLNGFGNGHSEDEVRKATPAEVDAYEKAIADASKPKLKAGDFVKFEKDGLGITAGKAYKIEGVSRNGKFYVIDDLGVQDYRVNHKHKYEILSAEEVAKHRESEKWAQIGRTKDEYKVGDVIRIVDETGGYDEGEIAIISEIDDDNIWYDDARKKRGEGNRWHTYADFIELVAPAESTLN